MQLEKKFKGEDDLLGVPLPALKKNGSSGSGNRNIKEYYDKSPSHISKNEKKQPVR